MWERVLRYAYYATKHNWTPEQVDRLPEFFDDRLPTYHEMLDDIHSEEQRRSDRVARAHGR